MMCTRIPTELRQPDAASLLRRKAATCPSHPKGRGGRWDPARLAAEHIPTHRRTSPRRLYFMFWYTPVTVNIYGRGKTWGFNHVSIKLHL